MGRGMAGGEHEQEETVKEGEEKGAEGKAQWGGGWQGGNTNRRRR